MTFAIVTTDRTTGYDASNQRWTATRAHWTRFPSRHAAEGHAKIIPGGGEVVDTTSCDETTRVTSSAGRPVRSFGAFLEDCYERCGERSTRVLDAATAEWDLGDKQVTRVATRLVKMSR